jgi:hypothetical protein
MVLEDMNKRLPVEVIDQSLTPSHASHGGDGKIRFEFLMASLGLDIPVAAQGPLVSSDFPPFDIHTAVPRWGVSCFVCCWC